MPKFIPWKDKKNSPSLDYGLTVLENLCIKYGISPNMKVEIEDLLKHICSSKSFARKEDFGILAGCCLIHIKQKHNQYASLSDLSAKIQCPMKKVYKFSKVIKEFCSDRKSSDCKELVDISEAALQISTSEMLESTVAKIFASVVDNKDEFITKTTALVKLAHDCWLMSGRSPEGVIAAAGYLCWKSIYPGLKSLTVKQFCSDFSLPYTKSSPKVSEIKHMLLKLGKNIPSCSKNYVNEKNILFHLNYILENSKTLRNDLLTDIYKTDEIARKEFSMYRRVSTVTKETEVVDIERRCDFQPNWNKPDVEISDSEISKYIRSEKEVELIKKIKEKYES
ncbi:Transcription factor IIIB 50 kDa subunit like protein [Argiope bruennichi]|uniref:Transcription factor IIIB 50 kDa subunit like protein n=2 Tax=Argiope bruennichi TaxID=94029 RepID=A0A8T0FW69_ARGBR|nr:Transcription factor IIIB 50 kDa subunit like protein [Argiope bruennichi]